MRNFGLVSVIMPAYNSERFIKQAINSVQNQTYQNFEIIVVDDCSTDNTNELVKDLCKEDKRIILLKNNKNEGAAISRNKAIEAAKGKYIAFLDSDDLWLPSKLEKQLTFMETNGYYFTNTSYSKTDENNNDLNTVVESVTGDYNKLLKYCPGNSTVIYNSEKLGKYLIENIRKRNDYVMWLKIVKDANTYGLNEVLGKHRLVKGSISSNKILLLKYQWIVYRKIEKLSIIESFYLCCFCITKKLTQLINMKLNNK